MKERAQKVPQKQSYVNLGLSNKNYFGIVRCAQIDAPAGDVTQLFACRGPLRDTFFHSSCNVLRRVHRVLGSSRILREVLKHKMNFDFVSDWYDTIVSSEDPLGGPF